MTLDFYQNKSDDRVVSKDLDAVRTGVSCDQKEDTSILRPVFLVSGKVSDYADVNYVQCSDYLRYYYITEIKTAGGGMTEIHCRVDPLMSWKDEFLERDAIVSRNAYEYNLQLDDSEFRTYSDPIVITKNLTGGLGSPCYVLTAAGRGTPVTP